MQNMSGKGSNCFYLYIILVRKRIWHFQNMRIGGTFFPLEMLNMRVGRMGVKWDGASEAFFIFSHLKMLNTIPVYKSVSQISYRF